MKKIKIGIIGCASIAKRMVIPAIKNLSNIFNLVAIASRSEDKSSQFAKEFNTLPIKGYENLIDRDDIDAVYIPLPTGLQHEWITKALLAKKHVIAEKSLSLNYSTTQQIIELAKSRDRLVMENFMFKYHKQHEVAWENIRTDNLGSLKLFRSQFGFPPLDRNNFRYDKNLGGGALLDAGAYTVMASRWFLGDEQDVMSAVLYIDSGKDVDVYGNISLKNKKGIVSQLSFGFDNFYQCNYEFWGSKGRLYSEKSFTPKPTEITNILIEKQGYKKIIPISEDNHFVNILLEFRRSIIQHDFRPHYKDILDQSRTLSEIREKAIKIQL